MVLVSCQMDDDNSTKNPNSVKQFLVLGHTYQWAADGTKIDLRLEGLDYSSYNGIWLGGDLCSETTQKESTLDYLDDIFDLRNPETLWTLGNHDIRNGNLDFIKNKTHRDLYYSHKIDSVDILVINSVVSHPAISDQCEERKVHADYIHDFLDACLQNPKDLKYLLVFSHITIWADIEPYLENIEKIGNQAGKYVDFYCEKSSTFKKEYAPKIFELAEKGVQLIFIAGDGGQYRKTFHHYSSKGIHYYCTGINNSVWATENLEKIAEYNTDPDSVLIMNYETSNDSLWGQFVPLSDLE